MYLLLAVVDQRLFNHSVKLALSFGCKVRGLRGGAHRSDTQSAVLTLDDGITGAKSTQKEKLIVSSLG